MELRIMLTFSRVMPAAAIAAALAVSSVAVLAQQQPAQPPQAQDDQDHHGRDAEYHRPMASQLVEARIAYLKTALQITPAQTAQFNAVADLMRKKAKERDDRMAAFQTRKPEDHTRPDPIEMMQRRQKMMTDAAAKMGETIAAWTPLYASLSDSQKQLLPELLGHHGEHHGGHGRW
jgi:leucyl aminopeptidase (aminopeptidase T)